MGQRKSEKKSVTSITQSRKIKYDLSLFKWRNNHKIFWHAKELWEEGGEKVYVFHPPLCNTQYFQCDFFSFMRINSSLLGSQHYYGWMSNQNHWKIKKFARFIWISENAVRVQQSIWFSKETISLTVQIR